MVLKELGKTKIKKNIVLVIAIGLLAFGVFNLSNAIYAQNVTNSASALTESNNDAPFHERLIILGVEQLLTIVGPITGAVVLMFTKFLNKKGIKISQETQEYFANTASVYVQNETRYMFKQFTDKNSKHHDELRTYFKDLAAGKLPAFPKEFGETMRTRTARNLKQELKSDSFSGAAKKMLENNLKTIIESAVSKNHQDIANRAKNLLLDLVPRAIDSALLFYENKTLNDNQKKKIIDTAVESLKHNFDQEYIIMSVENAIMYLQAELKNKINPVAK